MGEVHYISTLFGLEEAEGKRCIKCEEVKPLSEFGKASGAKFLRPECKDCIKILNKQVKQYKKIPVPKDYVCSICLKNEEQCKGLGGKKSGTWCIDHDHKTGAFRGWLCHSCNRGLGLFKDNPEMLQRAMDYLRENKQYLIPTQSLY